MPNVLGLEAGQIALAAELAAALAAGPAALAAELAAALEIVSSPEL